MSLDDELKIAMLQRVAMLVVAFHTLIADEMIIRSLGRREPEWLSES